MLAKYRIGLHCLHLFILFPIILQQKDTTSCILYLWYALCCCSSTDWSVLGSILQELCAISSILLSAQT